MGWYKNNPGARVAVRATVVAIVTYFIQALAAGGGRLDDWQTFAWGLAGAAAYAVIGFLTPAEPFVGVKATVEVPSDNAVLAGSGYGASGSPRSPGGNVRALSDLDTIDSERAKDVTYTYHSEVDLD